MKYKMADMKKKERGGTFGEVEAAASFLSI